MNKNIHKEGFDLPSDYFEISKAKTMDKIHAIAQDDLSISSKINQQPRRKLITLVMRYSSIAACLAIGVYFIAQDNDSSLLSQSELDIEYVDYLIDNADALTLDDLDTFGGLMSDDFIEDDELLDYLEDVDLDEILDLI